MSACWIRPATVLDEPAVTRLARRLRREAGITAEGASPRWLDDGDLRWVVEAGKGEIVGCCRASEEDGGVWRVRELFLVPEWRGAGLGRLLMETALRACQAEGALEVRFTPARRGTEAATLARGLGFRRPPGDRSGTLVRTLAKAT